MIQSHAFGLKLRSNLPIPGLPPQPQAVGAADVEIVLGHAPPWRTESKPHYEHSLRGDTGDPLLRLYPCGERRWQFRYADGTTFFLDGERSTIWATWRAPLTLEDTATYLLGPVLGFYLRLAGQVCLHASAVMFGPAAVAFTGAAGAGKSTLAAALAARGHRVLSEDVACLREAAGTFLIQPGYPRIRLWEDSARLLSHAAGSLPRLTPNWDKRYVSLDGGDPAFQPEPAPIAAICVLEERRAMSEPARLRALQGQEALSLLITHAYGNHLLDRAMRAREFEVLGRLAQQVPIRGLTLNADGVRLDESCAWIERNAVA